jgi:energy-coupling factor transporter ATP-binding protein EcfA2
MILLLDEPLADLDEQGSETVSSILNALDDVTVLIASPTDLPHGLTTRTYTITQAISAED